MPPDDLRLGLEQAKFVTDLVKYIATLASSSVLVLATFLGRVQKPLDKGSMIAGVALLLGCIVFCSMHLFFFGIIRPWGEKPTPVASPGESLTKPYVTISALIFLTFLGGMLFLGISVIRTL